MNLFCTIPKLLSTLIPWFHSHKTQSVFFLCCDLGRFCSAQQCTRRRVQTLWLLYKRQYRLLPPPTPLTSSKCSHSPTTSPLPPTLNNRHNGRIFDEKKLKPIYKKRMSSTICDCNSVSLLVLIDLLTWMSLGPSFCVCYIYWHNESPHTIDSVCVCVCVCGSWYSVDLVIRHTIHEVEDIENTLRSLSQYYWTVKLFVQKAQHWIYCAVRVMRGAFENGLSKRENYICGRVGMDSIMMVIIYIFGRFVHVH